MLTERQQAAGRNNILAVYDAALAHDPDHTAHGRAWYRRWSATVSLHPDNANSYAPHQLHAAFAALSPRVTPSRNLELLAQLTRGERPGTIATIADKAHDAINSHDPTHALEILLGKRSRANKTANFFLNLHNPDDPHPVTIDRHAYSIVLGRPCTDAEQSAMSSSTKRYEQVAQLYRDTAAALHILPSELQAATWTYYRQAGKSQGAYDLTTTTADPDDTEDTATP
jgi:hypothetical protein